MIDLELPLRAGRISDADVLAELVNQAGEGMPLYLWERMAGPGENAWAVGRARAARETGAFSWRNAVMIEADDGTAAGCLIGYAIPDEVAPIPDDMPAMFRPLQELENLAPGSWYVNVLAVLPGFRGRGLGRRLLEAADAIGREAGARAMSIIVADANEGARRLYARMGYAEVARRTMVKEGWTSAGTAFVLLTKPL